MELVGPHLDLPNLYGKYVVGLGDVRLYKIPPVFSRQVCPEFVMLDGLVLIVMREKTILSVERNKNVPRVPAVMPR